VSDCGCFTRLRTVIYGRAPILARKSRRISGTGRTVRPKSPGPQSRHKRTAAQPEAPHSCSERGNPTRERKAKRLGFPLTLVKRRTLGQKSLALPNIERPTLPAEGSASDSLLLAHRCVIEDGPEEAANPLHNSLCRPPAVVAPKHHRQRWFGMPSQSFVTAQQACIGGASRSGKWRRPVAGLRLSPGSAQTWGRERTLRRYPWGGSVKRSDL
jgi:hypothetical protein